MNAQPYLLFQLNQSRYGVSAPAVQEIFFLPEITAIADAPSGILGMVNRRGELLPVLDLHQQLGQQRTPFRLTDSLVVLEWQAQSFGIVVSQVDEVLMISADQITTNLYGQAEKNLQDRTTIGVATIADNIVTLLNLETLIQQPLVQSTFNSSTNRQNDLSDIAPMHISSSVLDQELYEHFDLQAQQILRERTAALRCPIDTQDASESMPLAVVSLNDEFFGFALETVHEFIKIHKITPIPCCPSHIIGSINLRGEIITLIDISDVIDLPASTVRSSSQAVIVRLEQRVAGIVLNAIFDVAYLHPSQLQSSPTSMHSTNNNYLLGVAPYQNRMMSIINLPKLLSSDVLVVNEEV